MLAALKTAPRDRGDDFCRAAFGPSTWPDLDRNGCSTRQDVLKRSGTDLHTARIKANGGTCEEVIAGTWVDAYTGARLTFTDLKNPSQAEQLQIDHLVSLFNAWVSGARSWAPERRVRFAQDLTTHELYAVSGAENFTKAYRGIESWQPGDPYRCAVARSYIEVKSIWGLTVTAPERDALASLMATCAPS